MLFDDHWPSGPGGSHAGKHANGSEGGDGGGVTAGVRACDGCGWVRCAKGGRGGYVSWL